MKIAAVGFLALLAAAPARAAGPDPADAKAVHDYVPTLDKAKAWYKAVQAARAAAEKDPTLRSGDAPAGNGYTQLRAFYEQHPKLMSFYSAEDLSVDDAILLPISLIGACAVAALPPDVANRVLAKADTISPAQIDFCKSNRAELKKIGLYAGG